VAWLRCGLLDLLCRAAEFQKGLAFYVETWHIAVDNGFPHHAECSLGGKYTRRRSGAHLHHVVNGQAGIFDVRHLVAAATSMRSLFSRALGQSRKTQCRDTRVQLEPGMVSHPLSWKLDRVDGYDSFGFAVVQGMKFAVNHAPRCRQSFRELPRLLHRYAPFLMFFRIAGSARPNA